MILAKFLNSSVSSAQQVICADADNWCTMFNVLPIYVHAADNLSPCHDIRGGSANRGKTKLAL